MRLNDWLLVFDYEQYQPIIRQPNMSALDTLGMRLNNQPAFSRIP